MTADAALQELFDDVRRTLARAGFDVTTVNAREPAGLCIRREADAVVVSWNPGEEVDAPGRHMRGQEEPGDFTQSPGIRNAARGVTGDPLAGRIRRAGLSRQRRGAGDAGLTG
jgi:hypothetical protein